VVRHFYYPEPDGSGRPVRPLWGVATRMLIAGGPWDRDDRPELYLTKANGIPRRPRQIEVYPGETVDEPDPLVSCKSTTGTLVRRMVIAGWSNEQIDSALSDRSNRGASTTAGGGSPTTSTARPCWTCSSRAHRCHQRWQGLNPPI